MFGISYGCAALETWGVPGFQEFARQLTRDTYYSLDDDDAPKTTTMIVGVEAQEEEEVVVVVMAAAEVVVVVVRGLVKARGFAISPVILRLRRG